MSQRVISRGPHTWPIVFHYHRCPECKKVLESRKPYETRRNRKELDLECPHCQAKFTVSEEVRPTLGPLWNS
jgi:uncharacterized C2H2 Zn-finger protein